MRIIILLATILFICSCSYTGHVIKEVIPEENGTIEVHFCPVDDCEGVLLGYLEDSIDIKCAFFDLELEEVIALLDSKDAKVVTDEDNPGRALMHNKFCILDDNIVITGSMNPTDNGVGKNNNNLVVISSKYLIENYNNVMKSSGMIVEKVIFPARLKNQNKSHKSYSWQKNPTTKKMDFM